MKRALLSGLLAGVAAIVAARRIGKPHRCVLERSQVVSAPVDEVFRFFEDPRNLAKITPPWVSFEVLQIEALPLRSDITNAYRIHWLGIPLRWCSLIVEYEPGRRFVDVQTSGPYRYWRHEHAFEDLGGSTMVRDRVEYEMPYGLVGRLFHRLFVARQLRQIFDYRTAAIERIFRES